MQANAQVLNSTTHPVHSVLLYEQFSHPPRVRHILYCRPFNEEVQYEAKVDRLRHAKFDGLREDKDARPVVKQRVDGT